MSQQPGLVVVGAENLARTLGQAADHMQQLQQADQRTADYIAAVARGSGPRRTGRLLASVRASREDDAATIGAGVPYGGVIHWGWPARGISAQPWIAEAAERTEPIWLDFYSQEIQTALDSVKGA